MDKLEDYRDKVKQILIVKGFAFVKYPIFLMI